MPEHDVRGDNYRVWYEPEAGAVHFEGSLRLPMKAYKPISDLLATSFEERAPAAYTMDFRELTFLNSSGINVVLRFVIALRRRGGVDLEVLGKQSIQWQTKSLMSVRKFLPKARIILS